MKKEFYIYGGIFLLLLIVPDPLPYIDEVVFAYLTYKNA